MIQVPENKKIYIGKRKYVSGDVLPPHVFTQYPKLRNIEEKETQTEIKFPKVKKSRTRAEFV